MKKKVISYVIMVCFVLLPTIYLTTIYNKAMFNPTLLDQPETIDELAQEIIRVIDEMKRN